MRSENRQKAWVRTVRNCHDESNNYDRKKYNSYTKWQDINTATRNKCLKRARRGLIETQPEALMQTQPEALIQTQPEALIQTQPEALIQTEPEAEPSMELEVRAWSDSRPAC